MIELKFVKDARDKVSEKIAPAVELAYQKWKAKFGDESASEVTAFGWRSDDGGEAYPQYLARMRKEQGMTDIGTIR